jgi:hypothetical protein
MSEMVLSIAQDFSPFPGGRYRADGPYSGERFRDEFLLPALVHAEETGSVVVVKLDGAAGYSSSFLEEVFGGLIRSGKIDPNRLNRLLQITADNVAYRPAKLDAEKYIAEEIRRMR